MELRIFQIDAFAERRFAGNPAAVVPLERWLPDATLQAIAAENNLAETAFFLREKGADGSDFHLRWFTPTVEVNLCGHATLASGHVISAHLEPGRTQMKFRSRGGLLGVERRGDLLALDFPIYRTEKTAMPAGIEKALGRKPAEMRAVHQWLAVYESEEEVANLEPDMAAIVALGKDGIIATAPGDRSDYVCRYFAPHAGIPEDPATGSAQCVTVPYWAERLGKTKLTGRQISARVGTFQCELKGERVDIAGRCVAYLEGRIHVD
ncbi:putative isomerase [Hypericibacter adhaerens]|jgi:PhzF family phenazine biosynthesis protein|uniref:Putative isomerase n=1 Tax=Hypericibacter adhaerens TaxID=2602016 RepID=A0A5J6N5W4_9PROT|nr:PhzF family phenazine biosynthesis protein [Hypericibacter adhaerens]QEX23980.1 putative isomerase [Hypericibacter adhaerens]